MSQNPVNYAVLASGRGSNFEALMRAQQSGLLMAHCCVLISDRPEAPVLSMAKQWGVPAYCVAPAAEANRQLRQKKHETEILKILQTTSTRFLVLAGYMRLLGDTVLEAFVAQTAEKKKYYRVVNIHPSLLPHYPGLHAYEQAWSAKEKTTGVTVHLVDQELDHGPICAQESFSLVDLKSIEEVEKVGLQIEHHIYPKTLNWLLREKFEVIEKEGRHYVRPN